MKAVTTNGFQPRSREEILAWLQHARDIKARKQREAEEQYAERQKRMKELEESDYYNFDWWQ